METWDYHSSFSEEKGPCFIIISDIYLLNSNLEMEYR